MLVEVFDEIGSDSGSGSEQSDTVYINMISEYEKPFIIKINDYEIPQSEVTIVPDENTGNVTLEIHNEGLYHYLKTCYYKKGKFVFSEYLETLDFNLVRPRSNTYPITFGYYDGIKPYFFCRCYDGYRISNTNNI